MMTKDELYNAVDALPWKYQIGDVVTHVSMVKPNYNTGAWQNKFASRAVSLPQRFTIVERFVQQCYGGVQLIYLCNIATGDGDAISVSNNFKFAEPLLVPYPDDIQWEHEPSRRGFHDPRHLTTEGIVMDEKDLLGYRILKLIERYGGNDGSNHKQWLLDQIVREITGPKYKQWLAEYENGEDGPKTYEWDRGIAP